MVSVNLFGFRRNPLICYLFYLFLFWWRQISFFADSKNDLCALRKPRSTPPLVFLGACQGGWAVVGLEGRLCSVVSLLCATLALASCA